MNILNLSVILAQSQGSTPAMLIIIYWLLVILWALGTFFGPDNNAWVVRGTSGVILVLFVILGLHVFGFH